MATRDEYLRSYRKGALLMGLDAAGLLIIGLAIGNSLADNEVVMPLIGALCALALITNLGQQLRRQHSLVVEAISAVEGEQGASVTQTIRAS